MGPASSSTGMAVIALTWLGGFVALAVAGPEILRAQPTSGAVVGRVSDERGAPLGSACVRLAGDDARKACTDQRGSYLLTELGPGTVTLIFHAPGFLDRRSEVDVPSSSLAILDVRLRRSPLDLEGVTATSERRIERGASVGVVGRRSFQSRNDIATALREVVAGLRAGSRSGQVGAGGDVRIRGPVSVLQGNTPLIYLDGVRLGTTSLPGPRGARQSIAMLSAINPFDVERIEVLRGASATTRFGSEASAGVILIVTRR